MQGRDAWPRRVIENGDLPMYLKRLNESSVSAVLGGGAGKGAGDEDSLLLELSGQVTLHERRLTSTTISN